MLCITGSITSDTISTPETAVHATAFPFPPCPPILPTCFSSSTSLHMPYFDSAHESHLEGCTLIDAGSVNLTLNGQYGPSNDDLMVQQGILTLSQFTSTDATHNSQERFPPPQCHPETREIILAQIIAWIVNQQSKWILWLYGPVGAGKSAIAQTIADIFSRRGSLMASFFFTRGNDRRGAVTYLIPTIAYQIMTSISGLREDIAKAVAQDPAILHLSLDIQIKRLIVDPFHTFLSKAPPNAHLKHRYFIIIDGLDECKGDDNQLRILFYITQLFYQHNLPFVFLITSRPEPHIANSFRVNPLLSVITQEFQIDPSYTDIRKFLLGSFREMRKSHPSLMSLHEPWPSQTDLDKLVYQSSGYFIYASTVVKFLDNKDMRPAQGLELVLSSASSPFSPLDELYHQILFTVPEPRRPLLVSVLEILIASDGLSRVQLEELLDLPSGEIQIITRRLYSLLGGIESSRIYFFHASFLDFLETKERSREFYVNRYHGHATIAQAFVRHAKVLKIDNLLMDSWDDHMQYAGGELEAQFLEDLRIISIDTWTKCLDVAEGKNGISHSATLEGWIESLEALPNPPHDVIDKFMDLLDMAYVQELKSGKLHPISFFTFF